MKRLLLLMVSIIMLWSVPVYASSPETAMKFIENNGVSVNFELYSTERTKSTTTYDLYTVSKINGKWQKEIYIRSIEFPCTDINRDGKYKYKSEVYEVDGLSRGHVYALFPRNGKPNHPSVPFWRKPIKRGNSK